MLWASGSLSCRMTTQLGSVLNTYCVLWRWRWGEFLRGHWGRTGAVDLKVTATEAESRQSWKVERVKAPVWRPAESKVNNLGLWSAGFALFVSVFMSQEFPPVWVLHGFINLQYNTVTVYTIISIRMFICVVCLFPVSSSAAGGCINYCLTLINLSVSMMCWNQLHTWQQLDTCQRIQHIMRLYMHLFI